MSLVANLPEKLQIFPEKLQIFPEKLQIFPEKLQIFPDPALWQKGLRFPQVGSRSSQDLQEKETVKEKPAAGQKKRLLCVNLTYKTETVSLSGKINTETREGLHQKIRSMLIFEHQEHG